MLGAGGGGRDDCFATVVMQRRVGQGRLLREGTNAMSRIKNKTKRGAVERLNRACRYFPCHSAQEDCTFCYCPFYPCGDKKLGVFVRAQGSGEKVWSCENCVWIHRRNVVDSFFALIRKNARRFRKK